MRVSAGWTGRFLNLKGVTYDGSHGGHPAIVGDQKFGTLPVPGWADENERFVDRRPEPFGPISESVGRWNGLHVGGDHVVFDYTIGATRIQEQPSSLLKNGEVAFVRTFRVGSTKAPLLMAVCDWESGEAGIQDGIASIAGASNRVLMVGLSGAPKGAMLERSGNSKLVLRIPKETAPSIFNLVIWNGTTEGQTNFPPFLADPPKFVDFKKGGPSRWPQTVATQGTLASSSTPDGAYVLDQLTAPEKNPWNRRIRFTGKNFYSASSLRVVREGIQIGFTQPLDPAAANDLQSYSARQWNYKRTSNYGSDQYDPTSQKKGQGEVEITAATLSPDGKSVTLKIANFQPVNQLLLKYDLKARDGTAIKQELLQTIHAIP